MVFLDRPAPVPEIDSVTTDKPRRACAAVTHLAACGHRRIAFLGDLHSIWTAAERERGYLEGLAAARIPVDRGLIRRDIRSGDEALQAVVELLAMAADRAVHRPEPDQHRSRAGPAPAGRPATDRPGRLRRRPARRLLDPPITVVAQDPPALGRTAARLLLTRLDGGEGPSQHVVVATRLVIRGSGEIPPGGGRAP